MANKLDSIVGISNLPGGNSYVIAHHPGRNQCAFISSIMANRAKAYYQQRCTRLIPVNMIINCNLPFGQHNALTDSGQ